MIDTLAESKIIEESLECHQNSQNDDLTLKFFDIIEEYRLSSTINTNYKNSCIKFEKKPLKDLSS